MMGRGFRWVHVLLLISIISLCFYSWYEYSTSAELDVTVSHTSFDIMNAIQSWEKYQITKNSIDVDTPRGDGCGPDDAIISFLIPSTFRASLSFTLQSLIQQTDCRWRAIVIYESPFRDGKPSGVVNTLQERPPVHFSLLPLTVIADERIQFLEVYNCDAVVNYAGRIRNLAMAHVVTEWVGFVDDDDTLTSDYVSRLSTEVELNPHIQVVIFRMLCSTCYAPIIPPESHINFMRSYVGIAFALRRNVYTSYPFPTGPNEDFCLLYNIRNGGHAISLSPFITYLVKGSHAWWYSSILKRHRDRYFTPQPKINRSLISVPAGFYPLTCQQKVTPSSWESIEASHTKGFVFPEKDNLIFRPYIRGLQKSLAQAVERGCLLASLMQHTMVEIHFAYDTPVTKGVPYIQIQVEQIHASTQTYRQTITEKYVRKLRHALQVWVITPSHFEFVSRYLRIPQTYFVSLWHMIDSDSTSESVCRYQNRTDWKRRKDNGGSIQRKCVSADVRHIPLHSSSYREVASDHDLARCFLPPIGCPPFPTPNVVTPCRLPKAFIYGDLSNSEGDRSLKLCRHLQKELMSLGDDEINNTLPFDCFYGIFGPYLDKVLCNADVVLIDRFYYFGALEFKGIDPLLKMGKAVVSMPTQGTIEALVLYCVVTFRCL
mmetsp:Transcript_24568/g.36181  ORF Transcript_24568/g.36181 Transcript_24568/m.36181 type:complete len:657 (-) Transcript_24568:554-2524(-)